MHIEINGTTCTIHSYFAIKTEHSTIYCDHAINHMLSMYIYDHLHTFIENTYDPSAFNDIETLHELLARISNNMLPEPKTTRSVTTINHCNTDAVAVIANNGSEWVIE